MGAIRLNHVAEDRGGAPGHGDARPAPGLIAVDDVVLDADDWLRAVVVLGLGVDAAAALLVLKPVGLVPIDLVVRDQHLAVPDEFDEDAATAPVAGIRVGAESLAAGDPEPVKD